MTGLCTLGVPLHPTHLAVCMQSRGMQFYFTLICYLPYQKNTSGTYHAFFFFFSILITHMRTYHAIWLDICLNRMKTHTFDGSMHSVATPHITTNPSPTLYNRWLPWLFIRNPVDKYTASRLPLRPSTGMPANMLNLAGDLSPIRNSLSPLQISGS